MPARNLTVISAPKKREAAQSSVVLYARVSSKDQEKEGYSIPAQQRLLREYAIQKRLTIEEEFVDVETAKRSGRTAFTAMLEYLKNTARPVEQSWWKRPIGCNATSKIGPHWTISALPFISLRRAASLALIRVPRTT